jgi:hypothetical protein
VFFYREIMKILKGMKILALLLCSTVCNTFGSIALNKANVEMAIRKGLLNSEGKKVLLGDLLITENPNHPAVQQLIRHVTKHCADKRELDEIVATGSNPPQIDHTTIGDGYVSATQWLREVLNKANKDNTRWDSPPVTTPNSVTTLHVEGLTVCRIFSKFPQATVVVYHNYPKEKEEIYTFNQKNKPNRALNADIRCMLLFDDNGNLRYSCPPGTPPPTENGQVIPGWIPGSNTHDGTAGTCYVYAPAN